MARGSLARLDEDDIPLPPGLPPGTEEVQDDDDIPMPDGPPPGTDNQGSFVCEAIGLPSNNL